MADAKLSRLGAIKGDAGSFSATISNMEKARALFLKLGSAEVLDAFERFCVFKGKTRERNIRGGKSVAFPITGKMAAAYHQPGKEITGDGNDPSDLNERVITVDSLMVADVAIAEVDELMNYWDARAVYTTELGRALAYEWDKRVARLIFNGADSSKYAEPLKKDGSDDNGGPPDNRGRTGFSKTVSLSGTNQEKGDALVEAIFDCKVAMEKKDVPTDDLYGVFSPENYYLITQSSRAINTDFNGYSAPNGTIAEGRTAYVAGIPIYSSNHVVQSAYTNVAGDMNSNYAANLSKCDGLIFHRDAVGVVSLLSPALQMTSGDWNISHQSTLLLARQAIGMEVLRAECCARIIHS
ncbi:minor capsid protein 10 [uncultured phage_MedDCM-OCT-S38-C3]|uniref:Minor capsid protein 10 n=1 Tax=uncultured phage_MedDCM-OCT-S38-C3 TaxID=2740803 RepID=A0A6S4PGV3_9CAUD|nr:minor capsid protein 10 [uncultured phage_MedDCM-OCT-S38-C3]BAQ94443.1 minor capsid protein 10 [uncultured phage_MedDCM-OCT-S38-C3]